MKRAGWILLAVWLAAAAPVEPPASTSDGEARAQALFQDIRCVVCQHESIADSPADMAADMRRLVREQVDAGRTDDQIRFDLTARYGDYILFRPPFRMDTLALWLAPLALLLGVGGWLIAAALRRKPAFEANPLSEEERRQLGELLKVETSGLNPDAEAPNDRP